MMEKVNKLVDATNNCEEIQEVVTAIPIWIVRWGITLICVIIGTFLTISAFISYPDTITTSLKINSKNSPKPVISKQAGKLISLLVPDGEEVDRDQPLAFLESTADPQHILYLVDKLKSIKVQTSKPFNEAIILPNNLELGEMQSTYETFYLQFIQYKSTSRFGYYSKKTRLLEQDRKDIELLKQQILKQKKIQELEYANQQQEYKSYEKLYRNKVISRSEFSQQENKFLTAKYPLQRSETDLIQNKTNSSQVEKQLLEINQEAFVERNKFLQSLNQCIAMCNNWIMQHILRAPIRGTLNYAGIVEKNQNVSSGQEIFIVNPKNSDFFGEIHVPQYNMGKIKIGEKALIRLKSYPFQQYGMLRGKLTYLSDVAIKDSIFVGRITFDKLPITNFNKKITLKNGMQAEVEIITEESSLLERFLRNLNFKNSY